MSQLIPANIDPNIMSGTEFADVFDGFVDAYRSGNSGSARPTLLQAGGHWIDDSTVSTDGLYKYKFFDGTNDITLFTINKNTQNMILASAENKYDIVRISEDSVGPVLGMIKKRVLTGGQTKANDNIGRIDFSGTDAAGVQYVMARMIVTSLNDVTGAAQGSRLSFFTTENETANLIEAMRLTGDKKLGIGTTTPEKTLHLAGDDSTTGIKIVQTEDSANSPEILLNKKRQTGNGQVLTSDKVGTHKFTATDEAGLEVEVAKVEVVANQDITGTANGTDFIISTKKKNSTAYDEALKISDGVISFFGIQQLDFSSKTALQDASVVRNLLTMDSSIYGAFVAEVIITGRDNTEARSQQLNIQGVFKPDTAVWDYSYDSSIFLNSSEKVVDLGFTNGASLVIDYVNQFIDANFIDGTIFLKVRRFSV